MEGLQDLGDLLIKYDWREVASVGVGSVVGVVHAIFDGYRGNEKKTHAGFIGALTGSLGGYHASEGFLRGAANGFLGGVAYGLVYENTHNFFNKILSNQNQETRE